MIEQDGFVENVKQEAPPTPPPPPPPPVKEEPHVPMMMNRKKQIMQQWQEETNQQQLALQALQAKLEQSQTEVKKENGVAEPPAGLEFNGTEGDKPVIKKYPSDFNADAIKQRLSKFSQADGNITVGF